MSLDLVIPKSVNILPMNIGLDRYFLLIDVLGVEGVSITKESDISRMAA
jgi:hypothetical protein